VLHLFPCFEKVKADTLCNASGVVVGRRNGFLTKGHTVKD